VIIVFTVVLSLFISAIDGFCAPVSGPRIDLGENFSRLTNDIVSEHVKWAKPLKGGPVRALFFVPRDGGREAVELSQRVDLDYDSVIFFKLNEFGHPRSTMDLKGASEEDMLEALEEKLRYPWDIIIIGRVYFEAFPESAQKKIMELVEGGTALLYVFPDKEFEKKVSDWKKLSSPSIEHAIPFEGIEPYNAAKNMASSIKRSIRLYQHGAGKIALVDYTKPRLWRNACLTPDMLMPDYEYHQALLVKLVLHLCGRDFETVLEESACDGSTREIIVTGQAGTELDLAITIRDSENEIEYSRMLALTLRGKKTKHLYHLPALKEGGHFVDVVASKDGWAQGWCTSYFVTTADIRVTGIKLDSDFFERNTNVSGSVELSRPLSKGESLRVELWDNYGRKTGENIFSGKQAGAFSINCGDPLSVINYVKAEIISAGNVLSSRKVEFSVPDRKPPADFLFIGWGGGTPDYYTGRVWSGVLKQYGVDGGAGGFSGDAAAGFSRLNMSNIPYSWRVGAHYESSVKDGVRTPCLTDPEYLKKERDRFLKGAAGIDKYGVPGYHLGDESYYMLYDPYHGLGSCYSESCQAAFREFEKERYGTIENLNEVWGSDYKSWEDFKITGREDYPRDSEAAKADHFLFIEYKFRSAHKFAVDCIQEIDPAARVGLEGTESMTPEWGINWYRQMQNFRLQNVYPYNAWTTKDYNRHCVRSFAQPGTLLGMWYGGYTAHRQEVVERWFQWYSLFLGFNSIWWYDFGKPGELYNALATDFSPLETFRQTAEEIAEIKNGVGKLIMNSRRQNDGVAIHYSYLSFIASHFELADIYERKPGMFKKEICAFINVVEDLGLGFDMVATEQIEEGELEKKGYKILVMPYSQSLTDKETAQILDFVRNGGMVIADLATGVRDGNCVLVKEPPIDELFGLDRSGRTSVFEGGVVLRNSFGDMTVDVSLFDKEIDLVPAVTTAKNLGRLNIAMGAGFINSYGEGKAVYLGFPIDDYAKDRFTGANKDRLDFFRDLFALGGVEAPVQVTSKSEPLNGMKIARFDSGGFETVMLYRDYFLEDLSPRFGWISFNEKAHLYNVRTMEYLGESAVTSLTFEPGMMQVIARLPYRVESLSISPPVLTVDAGAVAAFDISLVPSRGDAGDHVLRVEVRGPDGKSRSYYNRNILARNGTGTFSVPVALNDPEGRWVVCAQDVISGRKAVGYFYVKGD